MNEIDDMRLYGVMHHSINNIWQEVSPLLNQAIEYSDGKFSLSDVYHLLRERDMQLWVAYNNSGLKACCVTQIIPYPQKKVMFLVFSAGIDSENWLHFTETLNEFAKEQGCTSSEILGRRGWKKKMKQFGFEEIHTVFRCDLT